jgi:deubiquitinase DESI2
LNLYDLSPANDFLYPVGFGFHHSGVEVLGSEYSFASNAGVFESTPKEAPGAKFRGQILMGVMDGGQMELKKALDELRNAFGPNDYNVLYKNCNHFANAMVYRLLPGKQIPGYVNRIAQVGACCACLIPRQMLENAPVGDPDAPSNNNNSTSKSGFGGIHVKAPSANNMRAFTGTGHSLGDASTTATSSSHGESSSGRLSIGSLLGVVGSNSTNSTSNKGTDDLTDRREKARRAALARLEMQQQQSTSNESKDK